MESKKMNRNPLVAWLATAVFAVAGCTMQPTLPQGVPSTEAQGATLSLGFDWGRQVQVLADEVDGATVSVRVNGRDPIFRSFKRTDLATDSLDLSKLPGGDAMVHVDAYHGAQKIGEGERGVPLVIGRRTFANISVQLDSTGRTNQLPMIPLGPMPDPNARLFIRQIIIPTTTDSGARPEMILENRTGHPINDFQNYLVAYSPPGEEPLRSPIFMGGDNPMPSGFLDTGATVSVALDGGAPVWGSNTRTNFPVGKVQYQAGALSILKMTPGADAVVDFVQWGYWGSFYEIIAANSGLWRAGSCIQPPDPTGYMGVRFFARTPGARGVENWEAQPFGPPPPPPPPPPAP